MKKNTLTFIITCLLTTVSYGQQKFVPGYILKTEKDTLVGWVYSVNEPHNHIECLFKVSKTSEIQHFKPTDIYGYRLADGEFFISKEVEIEDSLMVVFMNYLSSGKINLFFSEDANKTDHYYINKGQESLNEISVTNQTVKVGAKTYSNPIRINRNLLKHYLEECPELFPTVDKMTSCKQKELINLLSEYNACNTSEKPFISYLKKTKRQFPFEFEGIGGVKNDLKSFNNKAVAIFAGVNIYYLLPILTKNSKLYLKSGYTIMHYNSVYRTFEETDPIYRAINGQYYSRLYPSYNLFTIPIQLQVQFTNKKFSPLVSLGVNLYKDYFIPCFNVGCKYSLTKNISAVMTIDFETYTPMLSPTADDSETKGLASYALNIGLRYRF